jgi:hypothetical protein
LSGYDRVLLLVELVLPYHTIAVVLRTLRVPEVGTSVVEPVHVPALIWAFTIARGITPGERQPGNECSNGYSALHGAPPAGLCLVQGGIR